MDWIKVSLDRLFDFLAALVPGCAILVVLGLHHPEWARTLRDINYLGYQTKVWLVLGAAFTAGWSVTSGLYGLRGFIHATIITHRLNRTNDWADLKSKPWQHPNWRALMSAVYDKAVPDNISFIDDETVAIQVEKANLCPEPERSQRLAEIRSNRSRADINDFAWKAWWSHLHGVMVHRLDDPVASMANSLAYNLNSASIVILCAAPFTPTLRHWWLITMCSFWAVQFAGRIYSEIASYSNPWSSFTKQMENLRRQLGKERPAEKDIPES